MQEERHSGSRDSARTAGNAVTEPEWTLGPAASTHDPSILALLRGAYPTAKWDAQFFAWQFRANPAGQARIWVAEVGPRVVACYVAVPHEMIVNSERALGWRVQDVLTAPDHRGRGIYQELTRLASAFLFSERFPVNFTFPNLRSHNAFIRAGWKDAVRVPLSVRRAVAALDPLPIRAQVTPIGEFGREAERVWEEAERRVSFAVRRSSAYLNWRYAQNPRDRYVAYLVDRASDQLVLVLKVFDREDGERWSHLCDLFYTGVDPDLLDCGVRLWMNFASSVGARAMSCWAVPGSQFARVIARYDLRPVPNHGRWLVVNQNGGGEDALSSERWHLGMGDSDVY